MCKSYAINAYVVKIDVELIHLIEGYDKKKILTATEPTTNCKIM